MGGKPPPDAERKIRLNWDFATANRYLGGRSDKTKKEELDRLGIVTDDAFWKEALDRDYELLEEGKTNRMVVWKNSKIGDFDIDEVVREGTTLLDVNSDYVKAARAVGMYVGEEE
mgnify:CR=1 FL=1